MGIFGLPLVTASCVQLVVKSGEDGKLWRLKATTQHYVHFVQGMIDMDISNGHSLFRPGRIIPTNSPPEYCVATMNIYCPLFNSWGFPAGIPAD